MAEKKYTSAQKTMNYWLTRKTFFVLISTFYLLNRGHDGGDDKHDGERDHDPIGEVVDPEEKAEVSDGDEDERLEERVGHVILHPTPEHNLHLCRGVRVVVLDLQILQLNLVFDEVTLA